jgi:hypothetical protein
MGNRPIIVVLAIIAVLIGAIFMWNASKENNPNLANDMHIMQPKSPIESGPEFRGDNDLIQYALEKINEDRMRFNVHPVVLSYNEAAQAHARDLLNTKNQRASHWSSNGMKPYMQYSIYGGTGYVEQNVVAHGYDNATIDKCKGRAIHCVKINPYKVIDNEERNMIYNDSKCCQNGHKENILDKHHTHVSIGIASNRYYVAYVQNFENNYIQLNKSLIQGNGQIEISGKMRFTNYSIDSVGVYYDVIPTQLVYDENKDKSSYKLGKLIASIVKPPPPFSKYEQPANYTLIQTEKWSEDSRSIDIRFDLSPVVQAKGVYTIVAYLRDNWNNKFPVMSYSVFAE